jgi:hypothetical protein
MWSDDFDPLLGASAPWVTQRHNHGMHVLTMTGGLRSVKTANALRSPLRRHYDDCAAGGCVFCNELNQFHYSFADHHLFWWTGPVPQE